jgi:CO/xanthine dehydrogenase FAD-binding subunit
VRSYVPAFEMEAPCDLASALARLAAEPGVWKPFAGGTDLMVLLEAGKLPPGKYLSIWKLAELRGIEAAPDHLTLGALTTYAQVRRDPLLAAEFPLLCRAASETGSLATQNRGTLGGNIANGSPAADTPPALLVYDAELELISSQGSRWVPYQNFHTGYKQSLLQPNELIAHIRLPRTKQAWKQHYHKVGTRRAQAISKVCFAGAAELENGQITDVRIAFGSIAPTPFRSTAAEALLRGATISPALISSARKTLAEEIAPIDDIRSTSHYRSIVAQNLLAEFLEKLSN